MRRAGIFALATMIVVSGCATAPSPPPLTPAQETRLDLNRRREVLARWFEGDFDAATPDGAPGPRWALRRLPEFGVAFYAERFPSPTATEPDAQEVLMLHVGEKAIEVETWRPTRPAVMAGDTARPRDLAEQTLYDLRAVPGCLTPLTWDAASASFVGKSPAGCAEPYGATWRVAADGLERNGVRFVRAGALPSGS